VQHRSQIASILLVDDRRLADDRPALVDLPPGGGASRTRGRAEGDTVQPRAQGFLATQGSPLPNEDQERILECVVGVVRVAENGSADLKDHRAVPFDERGEGAFGQVGSSKEHLKELAIGPASERTGFEQRLHVLEENSSSTVGHSSRSSVSMPRDYLN
jgi:hypothetical protein